MKRRDFLKNAGAALVPAALPAALWASTAPADGSEASRGRGRVIAREQIPVTAVLYDERYADCRAFAEALERHGATAFATNQDVARLWYGPLRNHLAQRPGRVAGLATYADFSIAQVCGRELGLTAIFEGEHDGRRSRSTLTHRACTVGDAREILASFGGGAWSTQLAAAIARLPKSADGASRIAAPRMGTATTARSAGHPGYLNSWLLAPV
jgi:hypothetical protein